MDLPLLRRRHVKLPLKNLLLICIIIDGDIMNLLNRPLHGPHDLCQLLGALKHLIIVRNERQVVVRDLLSLGPSFSAHILNWGLSKRWANFLLFLLGGARLPRGLVGLVLSSVNGVLVELVKLHQGVVIIRFVIVVKSILAEDLNCYVFRKNVH